MPRTRSATEPSGRLMTGYPLSPDKQVTLANWMEAPFNRWSFQHVREIIPTARISRGHGPEARLEEAFEGIEDIVFRDAGGGRTTLRQVLDATCTDAFLVLKSGRLVCEEYLNGMDQHTPHLLMSVSKSLTGTVAGILIGRGELDPAEPVTRYVPSLRGTSFEGATLRHVLDMRTGTRFSEDYDDMTSDCRQYEQVAGWRPRTDPQKAKDLYDYILLLENHSEHGGSFEYRSILTDLLAWILESVSGMRYSELMSRELWGRLGAEHDAEVTVDPHGHPLADGGISVTARDLARFGQMYLQNGRFNGAQIVPVGWVQDCRRPDEDAQKAFQGSEAAARYPHGMYRNQWWVADPESGIYLGSGIHGQGLFIHVPANLVIVKLSTLAKALDLDALDLHYRAYNAIAEEL